ncbi:MAG: hypothetical protein NTY64_02440 [Deltaproteobacteria bacterium]|nr:hypothetical protein [Deltaproteobacteria bacterium]
MQAILEDISETRKLQAQLYQAQKMEAIGTLAGGVAHDLNNILAGLVSYPDLLLLDLPDESPMRTIVTTIKNSGQRAAAIVQDLLTLARRGVAVREVLDLNAVVRDYFQTPRALEVPGLPGASLQSSHEPDLQRGGGHAQSGKDFRPHLLPVCGKNPKRIRGDQGRRIRGLNRGG